MDKSKIKVAFLSTYPPRECGIATFTKSFVRIFDEMYIKNQTKIIAVSDEKGKYSYSSRVIFEIDQFDEQSYVKAAEYINSSSIEVVSLQHEYGIFGGHDGQYILKFLENVNKPVITSFHSVLSKHGEHRFRLTQRIIDLSDSIVVMTSNAKKILTETFRVKSDKIKIVPHGVPNVRYDEKERAKQVLGYKKNTVLSTFGLINRGKGIENAIEALPEVVKRFPEVKYLVIGATHPTILKSEGESYRNGLLELAKNLGVESHVEFINKYLDYKELVEYLKATDIYLAPQTDFKQAFSGTLSYAIGCANLAISSPTNYAKEILAGGRGIITTPEPENLSKEILKILGSNGNFEKMRLAAYRFARDMIWPKVGLEYLKVLESNLFVKKENWKKRLPSFGEKPSLKYFEKMTDDLGFVQHANLSEPNYDFGYSLDDQARALIVVGTFQEQFGKDDTTHLFTRYLSYLERAIDADGFVHNFIDKDKNFADITASDDSISRSFWALAYVSRLKNLDDSMKKQVLCLLEKYEGKISNSYVKSTAYNLVGYSILGKTVEAKRTADILMGRYSEHAFEGNWRWFESSLTYANGIVPYSLVCAYRLIKDKAYLRVAAESAKFLDECSRYKGVPAPIGQDGWYIRNSKKSLYDQQSLEPGDMVLMFSELYSVTGDRKYRDRAIEWIGWYFGNNINEAIVYDNVTRGVYDAVTRRGVNQNQGAESIVVYLLAYFALNRILVGSESLAPVEN